MRINELLKTVQARWFLDKKLLSEKKLIQGSEAIIDVLSLVAFWKYESYIVVPTNPVLKVFTNSQYSGYHPNIPNLEGQRLAGL